MSPFAIGNFFHNVAEFVNHNVAPAAMDGAARLGEWNREYVVPLAIDTGARLETWHQDHVAPAMSQVGNEILKGIDLVNAHAGPVVAGTVANIHEKISPALENLVSEVSKSLHGFGEVQLGPALQGTSDAANQFRGQPLDPVISVSLATVNEIGEKQIIPGVYLTGSSLKEIQEKQLTPLLASVSDFSREKIAPVLVDAGKWVQDHPGETALIVGAGVLVVYPGLVTTPALWVLGFGSEGVGAGSLAAVIHSTIGDVAAGSLFSTLQSAGAGGAGLVVVDTAVSAAGTLGLGACKVFDATGAFKSPKSKL